MTKKYFGRGRSETLDWLVRVWLKEGPPVCFLDGFPGVGKTDLALDLLVQAESQGRWDHAVINEIGDRSRSVTENLMDFSSRLSHQGLPEMEEVLWLEKTPVLGHALEKALQRPVLIVMDQAQRLLVPNKGYPLPEVIGVLNYLRNRQTLKGRLLLLSDREVSKEKWSEWIPKRTLKELRPDEAVAMFEARLGEDSSAFGDVPLARKLRALATLHYNPRAIEALVARLRTKSLDEIMADDPGRWATEYAPIDPGFLRNLERDLLKQTMEELKEMYQRKLWRLSVYRYSFQEEGLDKLGGTSDEKEDFRQQLFSRFFLNFQHGALRLHPIVREISLSHLKAEPADLKQAHSAAADYYVRFFAARRILGSHGKLSEYYGELRYHLVHADRKDELTVINLRFTEHLRQEIKADTPVPSNRDDLDYRIGVLTILLQDAGAKSLEYHLARCLHARNEPEDLRRALIHAGRSVGASKYSEYWHFFATLTRTLEGDGKAVGVIRRGLTKLAESGAIGISAPLYRLGAEILAEGGKTSEAVSLLKEGIECIPPENNLFSLYELAAEILCQRRRPAEGIEILRHGVSRIEQQFGQQRLVVCALLLTAAFEPIEMLDEVLCLAGLRPGYSYATALSRILSYEVEEDWAGAARLARVSRLQFPREVALATHEALALLALGDNDGAQRVLTSFPNFSLAEGSVGGWLEALIELRRGRPADAQRSLELYLKRSVNPVSELNEAFLLRLWDEQEFLRHGNRLCFNLPILPPSITGLHTSTRRLQFAESVLFDRSRAMLPQQLNRLQAARVTIYVSYAWGEDGTADGQRQEERVEKLCKAVRDSGREIGRDRERMRPGSSIDQFAIEMSNASRIIAVMTAKSLRSEYCMARELYRAYKNCEYNRGEFQEKVIAIVTRDAKPLLKNQSAWTGLAKEWQARVLQKKQDLQEVDKLRKNLDLWRLSELEEEMAVRLPGMLEALCDIIMPQDFDEIEGNDFLDVVSRLP